MYKPIGAVSQITESLLSEEAGTLSPNSLKVMSQDPASNTDQYKFDKLVDMCPLKFVEVFPDPQDYCIGVLIPDCE